MFRFPHHASDDRAAFARARRRVYAALALAGASPLSGCYATRPLVSAPAPGTNVVLELNDRARVELGDRLGPSAARIEGELTAKSDSGYALRISSVEYLNGQSNRWSGEPFVVPPAFVSQAWQREFSRSRTLTLGAGVAAALLTFIAKTNLAGSGAPPTGGEPRPGGGTS